MPLQSSVAVGTSAVAVHALVIVGSALTSGTGAVVSVTVVVIVWSQVAVRPLESVAVQVIVVLPSGYGSVRARPSLRMPCTVTPVPVALGVPGLTAAQEVM